MSVKGAAVKRLFFISSIIKITTILVPLGTIVPRQAVECVARNPCLKWLIYNPSPVRTTEITSVVPSAL